jgi:6-pyruvoyltetrahydropterin/6-carboxytetrahydropterin synthase
MFEVGIVLQFEAAHRLHGDFGPASRRHGHTYRVEINVDGETLRDDGTLCDIALLQQLAGEAVGALNYQDLDDIEAFAGKNTTAETVADHLAQTLAPPLTGQALHELRVRVWESPHAYAGCRRSLR